MPTEKKLYRVTAIYKATVELVVEADPDNPENPSGWGNIVEETQVDYRLYDVESTEEITDADQA